GTRLRSLTRREALGHRRRARHGEASGRTPGRLDHRRQRPRCGRDVPCAAAVGEPAQRTHVVTVALPFAAQVRSPANALAPTVSVAVVLGTDGGVAPGSRSETRSCVVQVDVCLRRWTDSLRTRPEPAVTGSWKRNMVRARFAVMEPGASVRA